MGAKAPRANTRRRILLLVGGAGGALAFLFVVHLFYLQFLLVIWGVAVTAGIMIYERGGGGEAKAMTLGDAEKWIRLREGLADVDGKMSKSTDEGERRHLRARKASIEQELRKLRWSMREAGLETLRKATGQEPLRPMVPKAGGWRRKRQMKREEGHLIDSLCEAEEVLASEPPGSARARIEMIAADVRAHYRLLRELEYKSKNIGDYGTAWGVLTAISKGSSLGGTMRIHASKKVRGKLEGLLDLALSRGLIDRDVQGDEDGPRGDAARRSDWPSDLSS